MTRPPRRSRKQGSPIWSRTRVLHLAVVGFLGLGRGPAPALTKRGAAWSSWVISGASRIGPRSRGPGIFGPCRRTPRRLQNLALARSACVVARRKWRRLWFFQIRSRSDAASSWERPKAEARQGDAPEPRRPQVEKPRRIPALNQRQYARCNPTEGTRGAVAGVEGRRRVLRAASSRYSSASSCSRESVVVLAAPIYGVLSWSPCRQRHSRPTTGGGVAATLY